jgi:hypothetical protein
MPRCNKHGIAVLNQAFLAYLEDNKELVTISPRDVVPLQHDIDMVGSARSAHENTRRRSSECGRWLIIITSPSAYLLQRASFFFSWNTQSLTLS